MQRFPVRAGLLTLPRRGPLHARAGGGGGGGANLPGAPDGAGAGRGGHPDHRHHRLGHLRHDGTRQQGARCGGRGVVWLGVVCSDTVGWDGVGATGNVAWGGVGVFKGEEEWGQRAREAGRCYVKRLVGRVFVRLL